MSFGSQYVHLLSIVFKLKCWRLPFIIVVLAAAASQLYLFTPIQSLRVQTGTSNLDIVGQKEFLESNKVIAQWENPAIKPFFLVLSDAAVRMSGKKKSEGIPMITCIDEEDCQMKYFSQLLGKDPGKISHYINFNSSKDQKTTLQCQVTSGSELYCPFIYYLTAISMPLDLMSWFQFKTAQTFRVKSSFSWLMATKTIRGGNDTVCAQDVTYPFVIQFTLMAQMVFVAAALVFYLLMATVPSIYELKQKGLLKLVFHRRLSVWAYWLAIWTIALIEMLVIAIAHTVAHIIQCPGFHPPMRLVLVFLGTFVQLCCATAWILLITVLTRNIVIASFSACLLHLVIMGCIAVNRILFSSEHRYRWTRNLMFAIPFSHVAEQVSTVLLQGDIPMDSFNNIALPASAGLLVLLVAGTIYLDSVTKAGNGRRYPLHYIFTKRFWSLDKQDLVIIKDPEPSVMVENVPRSMKLKLCTYGLKKRYSSESVGLRDFSAIFYQDQITAVVGHNGSGKSTLLQILSGDRFATKGQATINKILITDPLLRNHLSNDIGYCPQTDALVDGLTVLDTLVLIATGSGLEWEDVEQDVMGVLRALQIDTKLNDVISSLSGSEKRKVCVTMALVGKPKVIMLDYPSRDLDYVSRRRLWRLLHEYKKGRAVIVSTLFIDDAEGMADRMIFMSGGRVICAGSPYFLRRAFDCRFIIQIVSKTEFHVLYMARRLIAKFRTIRVRSYGNTDLELEVSILEYDILPALIQEIEGMYQIIDEFGIKHHSLDEIYTKLQYLKPSDVEEFFQSSTIGYIADDVDRMREKEKALQLSDSVPDGPVVVKLTPGRTTTLIGLFIVHFLQIKRSYMRLLIRVVLPVTLLLILIGGAIMERKMQNEKLTVKYDLRKVDKLDTKGGVCFSYVKSLTTKAKLSIEGIPGTDCSKYLFAIDSTEPNIQKIEVPVDTVEQTKNFKRIITDTLNYAKVNLHCVQSKSPCPVIYSSDWSVVNHVISNHDVYIGAYVTPLTGTPVDTVMSLIHTFTNTLRRTTEVYMTVPKANITDKTTILDKLNSVNVEGITEMRSIFYPFYGMFAQLVLLAVLPSICLIDIIQDRSSGVFSQLLTMSMTRLHYWLCTLLNHWIQLALLYGISTLILMVFIQPGYMNKFFAGGVFAPTLIFGLTNGLLCVYIIGSLCSDNGYVFVAGHLFFSLIVSMSCLIVQQSDLFGQYMIYILPHYAIIAPTFYGTRFAHYSLSFFGSAERKTEINLLDYMLAVQHMRDALIAQMVHFGVLMALFIIMENRQTIFKCFYRTKNAKTETFSYEACKDIYVVEEVKRVESNPKSEENIMEAIQLQAISSEGKIALKNLTFGLKHGEIFGLLGPCCSGKSSALRVIVGDQRPSEGKVDFHVDDKWVSNDDAKGQAFIGYCPKSNPLVERLTVSENLYYYSRFIGAPTDRIKEVLKQFFLEKDANTVVMYATVGVKRRLTLAISVLHTPRFVAINQASAGVDPQGRQLLWQAIKSLAGKRRSMLVATQQMEEAESLCGRICIMTAGLMASLSNVEELFEKYKRSYFLEIHIGDSSNLTPDEIELAKAHIIQVVQRRFKEAVIIEQLTLRLQFGIPDKSIKCLSKALSWLVDKMKTLNFLYFSLHYATIDQIMRIIVVDNENQAGETASNQTALATV